MASEVGGMESCMVEFCLDIFKQIIRDNPSNNVFLSPSSIMIVMAMVHFGARGNTRDQMTRALRFEHFKEQSPHAVIGDFMSDFQRDNEKLLLKSANGLFPDQSNIISEQYIQGVKRLFSSDINPIDFQHFPDESRLEINRWVEKETNDNIKDVLAPGLIDVYTVLVVVNAIYFKGSWATHFDKNKTTQEKFYTSESKTVDVDMMKGELKNVGFLTSEELGCTVLELPYQGKEISMLIFLPKKRFGLEEMLNKLALHTIQTVIASLTRTTVEVSLPKVKLETDYRLNDPLISLGMTDLFDKTKANLSGMGGGRLYVSNVVHKAFVDVNEEGTEATAATAAIIILESVEIVPQFRADHPFLFLIFDKVQKVPLFIGRVLSPISVKDKTQNEEL